MSDTTTTQPPTSSQSAPPQSTTSAPPNQSTAAPAEQSTQAPPDPGTAAPGTTTTQGPSDTTTASPSSGPSVKGWITIDPDDGTAQNPLSYQVVSSAKLTLNWSSTNAASVNISGLGDGQAESGAQSVATQDGDFTLVAIGEDGTQSSPVVISVSTHNDGTVASGHSDLSSGAAAIISFCAMKDGNVVTHGQAGDEITLTATVSESTDAVTIAGQAASISVTADGHKDATVTVTLDASSSGDFECDASVGGAVGDTGSIHVDIAPAPADTTTAAPSTTTTQPPSTSTQPPSTTTAPASTTTQQPGTTTTVGGAPIITTFQARPDAQSPWAQSITVDPKDPGSSQTKQFEIQWEFSNSTDATASFMSSSPEPKGSQMVDCPTDVTTYTLTVTGADGTQATQTIAVNVNKMDKVKIADGVTQEWATDAKPAGPVEFTGKVSAKISGEVDIDFTAANPKPAASSQQSYIDQCWARIKDQVFNLVDVSNWSFVAPKFSPASVDGGGSNGGAGSSGKSSVGANIARTLDFNFGPFSGELKLTLLNVTKDQAGQVGAQVFNGELSLKKSFQLADIDLGDGITVTPVQVEVAIALSAEPNWKEVAEDAAELLGVDALITIGFIAGGIGTIAVACVQIWQGWALEDLAHQLDASQKSAVAGFMTGLGAPTADTGGDSAAFSQGQTGGQNARANAIAQYCNGDESQYTAWLTKNTEAVRSQAITNFKTSARAPAFAGYAKNKGSGNMEDLRNGWLVTMGSPAPKYGGDMSLWSQWRGSQPTGMFATTTDVNIWNGDW